MQFVDGNPNLVGQVRMYTSDPSTAANPLFSLQQVKDAINLEYNFLRDLARLSDVGYARKIAYGDLVADQIEYALPSDFLGRLEVEVSTNGSNLSTASPSSSATRALVLAGWDSMIKAYDQGELTEMEYYSVRRGADDSDVKVGIYAPPASTAAGTNTIKFLYEAESTDLSANTDEPDLPKPHHDLIAIGAAMKLLVGRKLPLGELPLFYQRGEQALLRSVNYEAVNRDGRIPVVGTYRRQARRPRFGLIRKGHKYSDPSRA